MLAARNLGLGVSKLGKLGSSAATEALPPRKLLEPQLLGELMLAVVVGDMATGTLAEAAGGGTLTEAAAFFTIAAFSVAVFLASFRGAICKIVRLQEFYLGSQVEDRSLGGDVVGLLCHTVCHLLQQWKSLEQMSPTCRLNIQEETCCSGYLWRRRVQLEDRIFRKSCGLVTMSSHFNCVLVNIGFLFVFIGEITLFSKQSAIVIGLLWIVLHTFGELETFVLSLIRGRLVEFV